MVSIESTKVKYPIVIEIPDDYWTITTSTETKVEYINNGDN